MLFNAAKKLIIILVLIMCSKAGLCASISKEINKGNSLYQEGKFEQAVDAYRDIIDNDLENPLLNYNMGTALYKNNDFKQSVKFLEKALLTDDDALKKDAFFNLANAYYKNGMSKSDTDLNFAIKTLEKSIEQYQNIISRDDSNEDALVNKKIVENELAKLKQKKNQQQNSKQQNQQDQKNNKDQNSKDQSNKDQEEQDSQQNQDSKSESQNDQQQKASDSQQNNSQGDSDASKENSNDQKSPNEQLNDNDRQDKTNQQENSGQQSQEQEHKNKNASGNQSAMPKGQNLNTQQQHAVAEGELTGDEAERLLNQYQQKEEPRGLLNFYKSDNNLSPVIKDW